MTVHNPWLAPDQRPPAFHAWLHDATAHPVFDPRRRPLWFRGRVRASHRPWSGLMFGLQWLWSVLVLLSLGMALLGPHGLLTGRLAGRPVPAAVLAGLTLAGLGLALMPLLTEVLRRRADRGAGRGLQVWAAGCAVLGTGSLLLQAVRVAGLRVTVTPDRVSVVSTFSPTPSAVLGVELVALLLTACFVAACTATAVRLNGYLRL